MRNSTYKAAVKFEVNIKSIRIRFSSYQNRHKCQPNLNPKFFKKVDVKYIEDELDELALIY